MSEYNFINIIKEIDNNKQLGVIPFNIKKLQSNIELVNYHLINSNTYVNDKINNEINRTIQNEQQIEVSITDLQEKIENDIAKTITILTEKDQQIDKSITNLTEKDQLIEKSITELDNKITNDISNRLSTFSQKDTLLEKDLQSLTNTITDLKGNNLSSSFDNLTKIESKITQISDKFNLSNIGNNITGHLLVGNNNGTFDTIQYQGSSNINTVGNILQGTWNASPIAKNKLSSGVGIQNEQLVQIDSSNIIPNDLIVFTNQGIKSISPDDVKTQLSLDNIENTKISDWCGTTKINTIGTIKTGVWNGSIIGNDYLSVGINNNNLVKIDNNINSGSIAKFTNNGLTSISLEELKNELQLTIQNQNNDSISNWNGSSNIDTVGTITNGTWNGNSISNEYFSSGVGLSKNNLIKIDGLSINSNDVAVFTNNGLKGISLLDFKNLLNIDSNSNSSDSGNSSNSDIENIKTTINNYKNFIDSKNISSNSLSISDTINTNSINVSTNINTSSISFNNHINLSVDTSGNIIISGDNITTRTI